MGWAQTAAGAAVAWMIAAVSILATGASPAFGYLAFGLAAVFTVVAGVAYYLARKAARLRAEEEAFQRLPLSLQIRMKPPGKRKEK